MKHLKSISQAMLFALVFAGAVSNVSAAIGIADLANEPLGTGGEAVVKPNIMFILDDSGSMNDTYTPEAMNGIDSEKFGRSSSHCNGLYFNPSITYQPPVTASGSSFANSSYSAARRDGFNPDSVKDNLAGSVYYKYTGTNPDMAYTYDSDGAVKTNSSFYKECNSKDLTKFEKVVLDNATDAVKTNYANWYSYYRTRMLLMKTAAGRAFRDITDQYRVGFSTINYSDTDSTDDRFLKIDDFDATQKESFYTKLYKANPSGWTPLRAALSKAGRMYAGQLLTGENDPVQYACQKNFTILSTDGYWNTNTESSSYGPKAINGTDNVGNQDFLEKRPKYDGTVVTVTTKTPSNTITRKQTVTPTTITATWIRDLRSSSASQNCTIPLSTAEATTNSGCFQDNGVNGATGTAVRTWCMVTSTDSGDDCNQIGTGKGPRVYACRGTGSSTNKPSGGSGCKTDGNGAQFCLYRGGTASNAPPPGFAAASCEQVYSGNDLWSCKTQNNGYTITTQPQKHTQTIINEHSSIDDITTQTVQTVIVQNGKQIEDSTSVSKQISSVHISDNTSETSNTGIPTGGSLWVNNGTATSKCSLTADSGATTPSQKTSSSATGTKDVTIVSAVGPTVGTPVVTTTTSNGVENTLADVAMYYYKNDLRTSNCTGGPLGSGINICGTTEDYAKQQMITFTLGLGVSGTIKYDENYENATTGDFHAIRQGTKDWPDPTLSEGPRRIDDLWHAAVNGGGKYFNANDPAELESAIVNALKEVEIRDGSASAAATSNLEPVAGDNFVYVALYRTVKWDGDIKAYEIDSKTGELKTTPEWTAQSSLNGKVSADSDSRTIYKFDASVNGTKLESFDYDNMTGAEKAYFDNLCSPSSKLTQCTDLDATEKGFATGSNLVKYLRGQTEYETASGSRAAIFRNRDNVLGDMISSQPVYVKQPPFVYTDTNYGAFKSATRTRNEDARVYVASNDGMLHAFNAGKNENSNVGGVEEWAYIPPMVMSNLYKLADKTYSTHHQYFVDGSPTVGDVCPKAPAAECTANEWKTILVGGLNAGGRGYYALDITNPSAPKAIWNFTVDHDADLGYSFGNPIITKRRDGRWIVAFTSGYNNVSPGNGQGYLYILDAYTGPDANGDPLEKIGTGVGDEENPSGLAKINAWINTTSDNTAQRFYGGDLLGNVWRFDIDDVVPPSGKEALLLAELGNAEGAGVQPITTKPELTEINAGGYRHAVVNVGTGRLLGSSDVGNQDKQSVYAFKDSLTEEGLGNVRTGEKLVRQTLISTTGGRTTSTNAVDWSVKSGWYVDLPDAGERVNVDMQQQLGFLRVAGNVPRNTACNPEGYAWLYAFDYMTGQYLQTSEGNLAGKKYEGALIAGLKTIKLEGGGTVTLTTDTHGKIKNNDDASSNVGSGSGGRRVSWRELID